MNSPRIRALASPATILESCIVLKVRRPPVVCEIQQSLLGTEDRELTCHSLAPSWCLSFVQSRESVKLSLRSTECLNLATGNWVKLPGALCMMAALDRRTVLLLNQSGKVRNLKAGESRGYKLLYCALTVISHSSAEGERSLFELAIARQLRGVLSCN